VSTTNQLNRTISFNQFQNEILAPGYAKAIDVTGDMVRVHLSDKAPFHMRRTYVMYVGNPEVFEQRLVDSQEILGIDPAKFVPVTYANMDTSPVTRLVLETLPWLIALYFLRSRGTAGFGQLMPGKTNARVITQFDNVSTTFKDVAGLPEAKQEIMEFVEFLKDPKKYHELGARIPKGALLVGPPGCGKTLLAKASAGEAKVTFFSTAGSEFMEVYAGVGAARVRDLFAKARENSPCIVFIDEIDAIGKARGGAGGSHSERDATLNALLVEMDGFTSNSNIVVLAGTNRPNILDPALVRPGRFDRTIALDNPDLISREEIFMVHLRPILTKDSTTEGKLAIAKDLARKTPGFSGAEIANVCNEAAIIAASKSKSFVDADDFEAAVDRTIGGVEKKSKVLSPEEKKIVAYHEAGHALVSWFLDGAPLMKVSIIPRGVAALGFAQYAPKDQYLRSKEEMLNMICRLLGGRIAESLTFGYITTGAQDDLQKVTKLAYSLVNRYGMNSRVGPLSFNDNGSPMRFFSDRVMQVMDEEVREIIETSFVKTKQLISDKQHELEKLAQMLIEKEVIQEADVQSILGERPAHKHYANQVQ
jgi:AFG3 family protein